MLQYHSQNNNELSNDNVGEVRICTYSPRLFTNFAIHSEDRLLVSELFMTTL